MKFQVRYMRQPQRLYIKTLYFFSEKKQKSLILPVTKRSTVVALIFQILQKILRRHLNILHKSFRITFMKAHLKQFQLMILGTKCNTSCCFRNNNNNTIKMIIIPVLSFSELRVVCVLRIYIMSISILFVSCEELRLTESNQQICDFYKLVIFEKLRKPP